MSSELWKNKPFTYAAAEQKYRKIQVGRDEFKLFRMIVSEAGCKELKKPLSKMHKWQQGSRGDSAQTSGKRHT